MFKICKKIANCIIGNEYLFSIGSKFSGVLIGLIYIILLNRYLGATLKGEYAVITNYLNIFAIVARFGMDEAYPFFRNREHHRLETYLGNIKSVFLYWCFLSILLANTLRLDLDKKIVLYLLPVGIVAPCVNYTVQVEYPKRKNISYIILNVIDLLFVSCLFCFSKANIFFVIAIISLRNIMTLLLACKNININFLRLKCRTADIKSYIVYGFFPMLTVLLMTINYRVDIIMLEGKVPLEKIGIYSLAVSLADKVWLIPDALKEILLSKLTKGKDAHEVAKVIRISIFCTFMACLMFVIFGKIMVAILFGKQFVSAYGIMLILLLGVFPMIFYKMIYAYNVVYGYKMANFSILLIAAVLNIMLNIILIPYMGVLGAAWASVFSYVLSGFLFVFYFKRKVELQYIDIILIKKQDLINIWSKIFK
ncbi:hypothetical protein D7X87_24580 [bacterium D16-54]|nr:hypothetical protein D7X87_24580 [bacterium D16-54]RKJ14861.1 hypothetical protein D7X65_09300 [bacterium D16-56]